MRRSAAVPSRGRRRNAASVSLFPFLAVLICTMGALILLLVVIARQARIQAAQVARAAAAKAAEDRVDLTEDIKGVRWRIEQIKIAREKTESQLAEARLDLGHIEDHARRLRDQLAQFEAARAELQRHQSDGGRRREELEAELARLRARLGEARQRLAEARLDAAKRRKSYAVVPYEGPNQTHRRPMYIECRSDTIILQPEGIELTEADFDGPRGPGSPLPAALRAIREWLLARQQFDPESSGEPYPLFLVRPEGISAFYAARDSMRSWASEFGYELIDEDWDIEFRPPDAELAEVIRRAVDTARARQQVLLAAAPRGYGSRRQPTFRAAPYRGGIIREDGSAEGGGSGFHSQPYSGSFGNRFGSAEQGTPGPFGRGGPGGSGRSGSGVSGHGEPGVSGGPQPGASGRGTLGVPGGNASAAYGGSKSGVSGGSESGVSGGSESGVSGGSESGTSAGGMTGRPASEEQQSGGDSNMAGQPGEWRPGQGAASGGGSAGVHIGSHAKSLADTRGRDWGLPDAARGSVPITRPIRIDCQKDRLILVPERGLGGRKVISLGYRTEDAVDELISSVWEHMDSWGMAGNGMYWRPTLKLHVAPDAQSRYADLKTLLENSGVEVDGE